MLKPVSSVKLRVLEAIAAVLMVFGAVALMLTFFPLINPPQWEIMTRHSDPSLTLRYAAGSVITSAILAGAFHFNRLAKQARKKQDQDAKSTRE